MRFLSIDPGISTGYVFIDEDEISCSGVLRTPHNDIRDLIDMLEYLQPSHIVIEDFILRSRRKSRDHADTCKNIGAVMGYATIHSLVLDFQVPSMRKAFVDIAKAIAPYGTSIHTIDALAHALAWHKLNGQVIIGVQEHVESTVYARASTHHTVSIKSNWNVQLLHDH